MSYHYREDRDRSPKKKMQVKLLLQRAYLLKEAKETAKKNPGRVREYFEDALDLLIEAQVCIGWEYRAEDIKKVDAIPVGGGWFNSWLESQLIITAPSVIVDALPALKSK